LAGAAAGALLAVTLVAGCQNSAPEPPPPSTSAALVKDSPRQRAGSLQERRELREKERAAAGQ